MITIRDFPQVELVLTYPLYRGGWHATARVHRYAWRRGGLGASSVTTEPAVAILKQATSVIPSSLYSRSTRSAAA